MAILRITRPPITAEAYEAVNTELDALADPPEGLILHCGGSVDGGWQIVDVWESEEHARRFDAERLRPAIERAGQPGPGPGTPPETLYELHTVIVP